MKKKIVKNKTARKAQKQVIVETKKSSCKSWVWLVVVFLIGGAIGYAAHYVVVNWQGFFVECPSGNKPDKNGCCENEVYTDAGDGWMVCCPDGGDNCFPPMK